MNRMERQKHLSRARSLTVARGAEKRRERVTFRKDVGDDGKGVVCCWAGISILAQMSPGERGRSAKHENTRRRKLERQVYHSTLPFENLRVLSPSAVSSGPNGIVEGLMALSKTLGGSTCSPPRVKSRGKVEGSRIEWAWVYSFNLLVWVLSQHVFSAFSASRATVRERVVKCLVLLLAVFNFRHFSQRP